jgi:hypothetical protein
VQIHRIGDVTVLNTYTEIPDSGSFPSTPTSVMPSRKSTSAVTSSVQSF